MAKARDYVAPRFFPFKEWNFALLYNPKAGTKSFKKLYQDKYGPVGADSYLQAPTSADLEECVKDCAVRALFVRNPLERIVSAYRYFRAKQDRFIRDFCFYPMSREMREWLGDRATYTFEEFVLGAIERFPTDKHIAPQHGVHLGHENFVWPFEDIQRGWQKLQAAVPQLGPLPWENAGDRKLQVEVTNVSLAAIKSFYETDFARWEDVCGKAGYMR